MALTMAASMRDASWVQADQRAQLAMDGVVTSLKAVSKNPAACSHVFSAAGATFNPEGFAQSAVSPLTSNITFSNGLTLYAPPVSVGGNLFFGNLQVSQLQWWSN